MDWQRIMPAAYWTVFVTFFLGVATWETHAALRELSLPAGRRWTRHAILLVIGTVAQSLVFRITPLAFAASIQQREWGLLNRPWLPFAISFLAAILLLDLTNYCSHRLFHAVPALWRVHQVHHSDPDYEVSTSLRFHPLEIIGANAITVAVVWITAPPVAAVFVASLHTEILSFLSHANARFPNAVERRLRAVFITPGLHRIHHSINPADYDRNFGQSFVWWDRLFGTYLPESAEVPVVTGIKGVSGPGAIRLWSLLAYPFRATPK